MPDVTSPRTVARDFGTDERVIERTKAVVKVLRDHTAVGEIKDIIAQFLPAFIGLWQNETNQAERFRI